MTFIAHTLREPGSVPALVIWVVGDGKPGHLNQSWGLAEALARAAPCTIHPISTLPSWRACLGLLLKRAPDTRVPVPDLIIGAGHATHLTLLAACRAHGGRTVVLMRPSWPRACFDLCILPEHDGAEADARTLVSEGALNRIRASEQRKPDQGLMLIGGVSPHFEWHGETIELQIQSILSRTPHIQWTIADSRRTPTDFLAKLPVHPRLSLVHHTVASSDWLPEQLARCATVWVTPDSGSMVFEALTSGADVGVFDLPSKPRSRVAIAIARLAEAQRITRFINWCAYGTLHPNLQPLAEADRCAQWILTWLKKS